MNTSLVPFVIGFLTVAFLIWSVVWAAKDKPYPFPVALCCLCIAVTGLSSRVAGNGTAMDSIMTDRNLITGETYEVVWRNPLDGRTILKVKGTVNELYFVTFDSTKPEPPNIFFVRADRAIEEKK